MVTCGRKEKHHNKIEHGLNLGRRRKEKRSVRIKSLPDLKDNSRARGHVDSSSGNSVKYIESLLGRLKLDR